MVGVKAADVGCHFCNPCANDGARRDTNASLISVCAAWFICQFQGENGWVFLVGNTSNCVDTCQQLADIVLVRLHATRGMIMW